MSQIVWMHCTAAINEYSDLGSVWFFFLSIEQVSINELGKVLHCYLYPLVLAISICHVCAFHFHAY